MRDPFFIEGPAVISFSGGRTSGYMLRRILDSGLQPDVHVLFANTGKERPETLTFVREVARRWGVPIHWLEYGHGEIDPDTASTDGEPFAKMIGDRKYLPNSLERICTANLKIKLKAEWMEAHGYDEWDNAVGLRFDEPRRVARMMGPNREKRETVLCPLFSALATVETVTEFWRTQPFDLQLGKHQGNCDLCFLKGQAIKMSLIRDNPASADWWIEQEGRIPNGRFRYGRMNYAEMKDAVLRAPGLPFPLVDDEPDDLGDCVCHE